MRRLRGSYKQVEKAARMYVADSTVVSLEPNTIEGIFETIRTIDELANVPAKAAEVVAGLQERLDVVSKKTRDVDRPKVFMLEWLEPTFVRPLGAGTG